MWYKALSIFFCVNTYIDSSLNSFCCVCHLSHPWVNVTANDFKSKYPPSKSKKILQKPSKTFLSLIRCNIALSLCIPSWDSKIFIFWQLFSKRLSLLNNKKGIVLYNFPQFFFAMYIYCKKYEIHQFSMRNLDGQVILTKVT